MAGEDSKKTIVSLEERIAERVGKELVSLIPEEQWKELINSQIDHFMHTKAPAIVQEQVRAAFLIRVKEILESPEFSDQWDFDLQQQVVGPAVKELFVKAAPEVFMGMIQPILQNALYNFKSQVNSGINY